MKNNTGIHAGILGLGASLILSAPGLMAQNADTTGNETTVPPPNFRARTQGAYGQAAAPNRSGQLATSLNLTTEQQTQFDAEMKDFQAKLKALQDEHDKKLAAILTPEQLAQFRAQQANRGPGGPGGPGRGGPGGGPRGGGPRGGNPEQMVQRMKTELNLTADQEIQITKILQESQAKMEALRTSAEAGTGDPQAMFAQMQAIHSERTAKINAVLTAEQKAKWQTMHSNRGPGFGGRRGPGGPGGPGGPRFGPGGPQGEGGF